MNITKPCSLRCKIPCQNHAPPHLVKQITQHGRIVWYVRIGHGPRRRVRGTYGTQEFVDNYKNALAELQGIIPPKPKTGKLVEDSFAWLLKQYFNSVNWYRLAKATQKQKELILMKICDTIGNIPYQTIDKKHIIAGVERCKETPSATQNFLKTLNELFNWAIDQGLMENNPTVGVKRPALSNKDGFAVWTEEDVEKYYQRWSHGTHERVWIDIFFTRVCVVVMRFVLVGKTSMIILFISKQRKANFKQMSFFLFYQNLQKPLKLVL